MTDKKDASLVVSWEGKPTFDAKAYKNIKKTSEKENLQYDIFESMAALRKNASDILELLQRLNAASTSLGKISHAPSQEEAALSYRAELVGDPNLTAAVKDIEYFRERLEEACQRVSRADLGRSIDDAKESFNELGDLMKRFWGK